MLSCEVFDLAASVDFDLSAPASVITSPCLWRASVGDGGSRVAAASASLSGHSGSVVSTSLVAVSPAGHDADQLSSVLASPRCRRRRCGFCPRRGGVRRGTSASTGSRCTSADCFSQPASFLHSSKSVAKFSSNCRADFGCGCCSNFAFFLSSFLGL